MVGRFNRMFQVVKIDSEIINVDDEEEDASEDGHVSEGKCPQ